MAEGDQFDLGELVGTIKFEIPAGEKEKMETMQDKAPMMDKVFGSFKRGGAAFHAAFLTVAMLGSSGMRQTLKGFADLFQGLMDLVFVALMPVIEPLLQGFADFVQLAASHPEGILGAISDLSFWEEAGGILVSSLSEAWNAGVEVLSPILEDIGIDPDALKMQGSLDDFVSTVEDWTNPDEFVTDFSTAVDAAGKVNTWLADTFFSEEEWSQAGEWVGDVLTSEEFWKSVGQRIIDTLDMALQITKAVGSFIEGVVNSILDSLASKMGLGDKSGAGTGDKGPGWSWKWGFIPMAAHEASSLVRFNLDLHDIGTKNGGLGQPGGQPS